MTYNTSLMSVREEVIYLTKSTGVLPAIKLHEAEDLIPYAEAMIEAGIRILEVTMTTPGVLHSFKTLSALFGRRLYLAAGTCLDASTARAAIEAGARVIVSPAVIPEVIATANRYGVACYSGAFTATECLTAMQAGADMVKIFPAQLGGPKYMANLKMVFPEINLIPSGGIGLETAGDFVRNGACAVSGARNFFDREKVAQHGLGWITDQSRKYMQIVADAKADPLPLP
jgi:2-dehydro-3-deoxyphosphogluconate aldolase / (4S)-4-hydroxy-2-oxoglutarate aldolase